MITACRLASPAALRTVFLHRYIERGEIAVDTAIAETACLVPSPPALTRDTEAGMRHENDEPPARAQRPAGRGDSGLQRVDVLNAQEEGRRVELFPAETGQGREFRRISNEKTDAVSMVLSSMRDKLPALVDAGVARARGNDGGGESARPAADIEQVLALPRGQQPHQGRDRQF